MKLLTLMCLLDASLAASAAPHAFGPEAAQASLKDFKVANGLELSLFASEPMLRNPTDMDIDERGRVWITEGVNYRSSFQPWGVLQPAGDRIVILEDTDGDGIADKATTFYQGPEINAALGICVLGNRVIVSCSPNVYIFTDTDGDGKADKKELLFTGISGVDHDHGVHAMSFGPDGKLYFNMGNESRQLKDKDGKPIIDLAGNEVNNHGKPYRQGMAFRCNLDGSEVEVLAHNFRNPYEVAVDSFGTLWQSDNDDDGNRATRLNYLMEYGNFGFSDEMTGAGWPERRTNLEPDIPSRHWHQNDPGVVPNLFITGAGAPTGIAFYEGNLLPESMRNNIILADAGSRVIQAFAVRPEGAGYHADRVELVSSSDTWFRPSDICVAPDGSIYIADWNDAGVGGHNMADRDPKTMTGRVYRLAPPGVKPSVPKLDLKTAAGCVKALQSPNLSTRYLAWTALRAMPNHGEKELMKLWNDTKANPRMRARALFLLAQEKQSTDKFVKMGLKEKNPDLRITALRIAQEAKLDVIPMVQTLVNDPSPQVRRECAIALRHNPSPEAPKLWATLAHQHDGNDRWYLEALGIGADKQEDKFYEAWLTLVGDNILTNGGCDIIWRSRAAKSAITLAALIDSLSSLGRDNACLRYFRAFDFIAGPEKVAALRQLLLSPAISSNSRATHNKMVLTETLTRLRELDLNKEAVLKDVILNVLKGSRGETEFANIVQDFKLKDQNPGLLEVAIRHPDDPSGVEAVRMILAYHDTALLEKSLQETNTATKLVEALGNTRDKNVLPLLLPLVTDTQRDAALRRQAVRSLSQIQDGANQLLQLAQADRLPDDVKYTATMELNRVRWPELKEKAAKLLPLPQTRNAESLPPVSALLKREGNVGRGSLVFARTEVGCINCHRVNDKGADLGPALSEIGTKLGKDALYEAILDPSAGIAFGYEAWRIELKSGDEAYGLITSETADELTIKDAKAISTRLKKSDITKRQQMKISLMPSGLQQTMSTQDLVDLVEYLASLKKAGN
ncbi:MAG: dehydrogenase [Pedosphaera sp.]|nr:dehydrogenase [Pedosphaera sp.]